MANRNFEQDLPRLVLSPYGGEAWLYLGVYWYITDSGKLYPVGDDDNTTICDRNFVAAFLAGRGFYVETPRQRD